MDQPKTTADIEQGAFPAIGLRATMQNQKFEYSNAEYAESLKSVFTTLQGGRTGELLPADT